MTATCDVALKEWDAQVRVLEAGGTALIVRKGGIVETRGAFEVEHMRFWLYPTFLHQNTPELRSEFHPFLHENPASGTVLLRSFATVQRVWKLTDVNRLRTLEPHQSLTVVALERRFAYRDRPWVHALLLRVYTLENPVPIAETPMYAGCVSWVPLEHPVSLEGLRPAMDDVSFAVQRNMLEQILG